MKKTLKRLCTGFLALATVVTALPTTPVHAESKQYWTESKERVATDKNGNKDIEAGKEVTIIDTVQRQQQSQYSKLTLENVPMDSDRKEVQNKVLKELSVEEIYNYYEQANIKEKEWIKQLVFECQIVQDIGRNIRKIKVDKTIYILEKLGFKWAPVGKKEFMSAYKEIKKL